MSMLMALRLAFLLFMPAVFGTVSRQHGERGDINVADILNVRNVPSRSDDRDAFCFVDRGAWHGFALPEGGREEFLGGFIGPKLLDDGRWISKSIIHLSISDNSKQRSISFRQGKSGSLQPGSLRQHWNADSVALQATLWYATGRTAVVLLDIRNLSGTPRNFDYSFSGNLLDTTWTFHNDHSGVIASSANRVGSLLITFPPRYSPYVAIYDHGNAYVAAFRSPIRIKGHSSSQFAYAVSFFPDLRRPQRELATIQNLLADPITFRSVNEVRWENYVEAIRHTCLGDTVSVRSGLKCFLTLISNWRTAARALRHDGLYPSYHYRGFNGFWAWDSWKHSAALAPLEPNLARNQIRAMFDYQDSTGMVADCIFADSMNNNWLNTKPPLAAWAVMEVFWATKDTGFVKELLPRLQRYHQWWYRYRDHDGNGLCEYGSTANDSTAGKWESGMDNAIRFDGVSMVYNDHNAWSMSQESVDLNSFLYAEKIFLSELLELTGDSLRSRTLLAEASALRQEIRTQMFDSKTGFFYDRRLGSGELVHIMGPEGWIPLWAGVATEEQARMVRNAIMDTSLFNTYLPFPTVAANTPGFSPSSYWRGPVWIDQAYFAIRGLERYGYRREATELKQRLLSRIEGFLNSDQPINENYSPLTGKRQDASSFGWSAAHLLMLLMGR